MEHTNLVWGALSKIYQGAGRRGPNLKGVGSSPYEESHVSLGEGRFYGREGVMILVADDIFMKMSDKEVGM